MDLSKKGSIQPQDPAWEQHSTLQEMDEQELYELGEAEEFYDDEEHNVYDELGIQEDEYEIIVEPADPLMPAPAAAPEPYPHDSYIHPDAYNLPKQYTQAPVIPQPIPQDAPDARSKAVLAHLSPLLTIICTIIMWSVYKGKPGFELTRHAAARTLNMVITLYFIYVGIAVVAMALVTIGAVATANANNPNGMIVFYIIGGVLMGLVSAYSLVIFVFHIIAAVKVNKGIDYRYPLPHLTMVDED